MIIITFNAYDLKLIQNSYDQIKSLVSTLEGNITPLWRLPQQKRRITVLKSPHVKNKAKEQFEWITYKGQCKIKWKDTKLEVKKLSYLLILALSNLSFPGTQVNIKTLFQTPIIHYGAKL